MKPRADKHHAKRTRPIGYAPRGIQIAAAAPSLLLWTLLVGIAAFWYLGVAINATTGRLANTADWRFPYLLLMLLLVLACAAAIAKSFWRAFVGRSRIWWHLGSFGLGILLLGLLGLVGD